MRDDNGGNPTKITFSMKKSHQIIRNILIKMHIWTKEFIANELSTLEISRLKTVCKTQHKVKMIFNYRFRISKMFPWTYAATTILLVLLILGSITNWIYFKRSETTNLISTSLSSYLLTGEIRTVDWFTISSSVKWNETLKQFPSDLLTTYFDLYL